MSFENQWICQATAVLPGRGQIVASWLLPHWPSGFTGVIDGGSGTFAHVRGQFTATELAGGALKFSATLN